MAGIKLLILLLGVATVSACSPYVYSDEITSFSNGVTAVVSGFQTGEQSVNTMIAQQQLAADVSARTRLMLLPGCNQIDPSGTPPRLPDCAAVTFGTTTPPAPTSVQQNFAAAAPAFDALRNYAASLLAVTNAADEATLKTASEDLTASASNLAGTVAKLDPAAHSAADLTASAGGLLGQGLAIYLNQRRYKVLRDTVPAVDPYVQTLGRTVRAALLDIRAQQVEQIGPALRNDATPFETDAVARMSDREYQSKLAALNARIAAFNVARAVDPTATVAAMVNAHHELSAALQSNTGQVMAVLASAEEFATVAEQMRASIADASAAAAAPGAPSARTAAGKK